MNEVLIERTPSGLATVTLNRPERRNAVNLAMWRRMREAFDDCAGDREVRGVVLTGAGGHFCAGADIGEFAGQRHDADSGRVYGEAVEACQSALAAIPKPTVAAIAGSCIGGGCALALCCDFRVGDRTARLGIPAARLGIVYGVEDCRRLLSCVSPATAKRMLFGAEIMDAAAAAAAGLLDRLADDDVMAAAADHLARMIESAPISIAGAKLTLRALQAGRLERDAAEIAELGRRSLESRDYQEGLRAFAEKRPPKFTGE